MIESSEYASNLDDYCNYLHEQSMLLGAFHDANGISSTGCENMAINAHDTLQFTAMNSSATTECDTSSSSC